MPFPWNDLDEKLTGDYIANHSCAGVCREMLQRVVQGSSKERVVQKLVLVIRFCSLALILDQNCKNLQKICKQIYVTIIVFKTCAV